MGVDRVVVHWDSMEGAGTFQRNPKCLILTLYKPNPNPNPDSTLNLNDFIPKP